MAESLSDTLWDVVICGTGLPQSLLALSLSRSDKKILHIDPNEYYGGAEAAFSLQEAGTWVNRLSLPTEAGSTRGVFRAASITKPPTASTSLSFPRAYSLALAPQFIHARSELLSQLVSSRAYRQVEFLAVGSFFIIKPASAPTSAKPTIVRIPSTREDVFSTTAISAKAKRVLMKFLKFVVAYDSDPQTELWQQHADTPLADFLHEHFKMDAELQTYITTLTLSLDGRISTKDGLAVIHRHLSSMGVFGLGFAAIYPKWGGLSEIAQVSCRAGAVGGAIYMLGTGIKNTTTTDGEIRLELTSGDSVKTRMLVRGDETVGGEVGISRLVAVIDSTLKTLFEVVVEGAPAPGVAVIALPAGAVTTAGGKVSDSPVYVLAHSSDTGECPVNQSVLYLTTLSTTDSKDVLQAALGSFLTAVSEDRVPDVLYELYYEQDLGSVESQTEDMIFHFPGPSLSLSFDDRTLGPVREAWEKISGGEAVEPDYMIFTDREGALDDDDVYD
ncbi:GDP dissociation inhibitor-domain-containing protein [Bombardia bombarda]|uniref:Rab proteins geranylgeranyltransferase n=1 Tax=Bombardia bombarda TaxID=252184 RepID=A0AA39W524_9PEZI|nr:GDP dissociation inhibitor-domain-containing protein [Bombardia bombarda]